MFLFYRLSKISSFRIRMIPFPDISPEIFSIELFGINFRASLVCCFLYTWFHLCFKVNEIFCCKKAVVGIKKPTSFNGSGRSFLTYLILGVIIGGRLGYVIFYNLEYYAFNPLAIFRIWDGGMAFHGGFIGVIICRNFFLPSK